MVQEFLSEPESLLTKPVNPASLKALIYTDGNMPATDPLHARDWEEMAAIDPLWAILSAPEKRFGSWDIDEFLRTGQE
ncbi:MAG TPA: hypothetical protein VFF39_17695 [Verrucomicrobiae bacterium]|nr:hypothetical protein [Verrucomicrobiae bacterium]